MQRNLRNNTRAPRSNYDVVSKSDLWANHFSLILFSHLGNGKIRLVTYEASSFPNDGGGGGVWKGVCVPLNSVSPGPGAAPGRW